MKKFLSIALFCAIFVVQLFVFAGAVSAQNVGQTPANDLWVRDDDVTFAGKLAKRSSYLLNWVISNYQWANLTSSGANFDAIWVLIRNIVYGILALFILVAAFLLITTRGKSLTIRKFIPRFIFTVVLVTLSLSLLQFIYQIGDIAQSFFLKKDPQNNVFIQDSDLLAVSFNYGDFIGYRKFGPEFNESVFISTLMVKLTAMTYYAMFAILIIRKIILWFFLVVSPIFPLLLLFYPLRNTAKIWIGEFFRWLLYGPLFAILLAGLVALWSQGKGIPLKFDNVPCDNPPADISAEDYPTAISILLGGPCQQVTQYNSLNTTDSFIQYVVALMMLWMVIIVPFILLKVFLDYFGNMNLGDSSVAKYIKNSSSPFLTRYGLMGNGGPPSPGFSPPGGSVGKAMVIPTEGAAAAASPALTEIQSHMQQTAARTHELAEAYKQSASEVASQSSNLSYEAAAGTAVAASQAIAEILNLTNLSVPTMQDVAKYEAGLMSSNTTSSQSQEAHRVSETLNRISGTSNLASPMERARFTEVRQQLVTKAQSGNAVANSILSASMGGQASIPSANQVQQVNLDDYEEVKKLWIENFRKLDVPADINGNPRDRKEWLNEEVGQIPVVIELLLSGDPKQVEKGKNMVAKILPFLLLGGFSKEEIIAYLKAKLEAAKQVLNEMVKGEVNEDDQVDVETKPTEQPKSMEMSAEVPEEGKPKLPPINVPEHTNEPSVTVVPQSPGDKRGSS